ncbi:MAG: MBL fold metallo-hydrolase [Gammaproteobacteria bacterium]|nr:MBL fold metallo-hydrolase [Gammaproteobacteria bacterium]
MPALLVAVAACWFAGAPPAHAGEPVWDGNKVEMRSETLAPGVYAYYAKDAAALNAKGGAAATSGGLIVGSKGVLLIETMLNKRLNSQVLALTSKNTSLPITYAVNTSAHGDHSYGNMYLPASTKIVQHVRTRQYVDTHLAKDKVFMIQNFGAGRGIEEIRARTGDVLVGDGGSITLDLGGKQVQIIDFGFAQTGGDLFIWEPEAKVMWTGNPIVAAGPSLPWLLDGHLVETLATLKKVHAFLPADARIVPGHGVAITRDGLQWHIDYLEAVKAQVQAAVDEGLSLEATVAKVQLPEFRGYVLFDWVHPSLNVPAAYKDLKTVKK